MNYEIFKDSKGKFSSKRVFGGLGFAAAIVMIACGVQSQDNALLLIVSAGMLGFDSILDIFKK